jgi:hypothetical protein
MAELTYRARKKIKRKNFAIKSKAPGSGSYPIHDLRHARNALARVSHLFLSMFISIFILPAYCCAMHKAIRLRSWMRKHLSRSLFSWRTSIHLYSVRRRKKRRSARR